MILPGADTGIRLESASRRDRPKACPGAPLTIPIGLSFAGAGRGAVSSAASAISDDRIPLRLMLKSAGAAAARHVRRGARMRALGRRVALA